MITPWPNRCNVDDEFTLLRRVDDQLLALNWRSEAGQDELNLPPRGGNNPGPLPFMSSIIFWIDLIPRSQKCKPPGQGYGQLTSQPVANERKVVST